MAVTMESELPVEPQSLKKLSFKSLKRALDLFSPLNGQFPPPDPASKKIRMNHKLNAEYRGIGSTTVQPPNHANSAVQKVPQASTTLALTDSESSRDPQKGVTQNELVVVPSIQPKGLGDTIFAGKSTTIIPAHETSQLLPSWKEFQADGRVLYGVLHGETTGNVSTAALMERIPSRWPRPVWRPPWRNYRVISGHLGWVRSVAFDPSNEWFCTGSADRTIKIWDVATGTLRLTLTGHIEQVRGLAVSTKHTYMFSAGDDKQVKCWDLEQNKVIRSYHGHLSGVFCLALHPTIDVLLTGGRDSVCRVWDIRSKMQIHVLSGHDNIVCSVFTRPTDPQVVTGSHDTTIKFWDLRYVAGKTMVTLTHHKKSVRAMAQHPIEDCFASASADNVKKFNLPKGEFLHNMLSQQKTIINAMAVNEDGVMVTGGDNGSMWFWDWKSGHNFQRSQTIVQPGSLDSEAGIYATSFDHTGTMLVTCEADKTIKMWKEDPNATPETHPLNFKPPKEIRRF